VKPVAPLGCDVSSASFDATPSQACVTMAGATEHDNLFEKLWKWSGGRG
jgi:hypothetical protein